MNHPFAAQAGGLATRALAGVDLDEAFERLSRWADARGRVSRGAFGAALADLAHAGDGSASLGAAASVLFDAFDVDGDGQGRKRVIQRRFNVSVPRARVPEKSSTLRDRSER